MIKKKELNLIALILLSFLVQVFVHELGHTIAVYACGGIVEGVEITPDRIGLLCRVSSEFDETIAYSGPLAPILLGLALIKRKMGKALLGTSLPYPLFSLLYLGVII